LRAVQSLARVHVPPKVHVPEVNSGQSAGDVHVVLVAWLHWPISAHALPGLVHTSCVRLQRPAAGQSVLFSRQVPLVSEHVPFWGKHCRSSVHGTPVAEHVRLSWGQSLSDVHAVAPSF
jgi:hypothetical protein